MEQEDNATRPSEIRLKCCQDRPVKELAMTFDRHAMDRIPVGSCLYTVMHANLSVVYEVQYADRPIDAFAGWIVDNLDEVPDSTLARAANVTCTALTAFGQRQAALNEEDEVGMLQDERERIWLWIILGGIGMVVLLFFVAVAIGICVHVKHQKSLPKATAQRSPPSGM